MGTVSRVMYRFTTTDTAFMRSDVYHEVIDTADKLDYPQMAEVVRELGHALKELATPKCPRKKAQD